jgi:hypothetical protein
MVPLASEVGQLVVRHPWAETALGDPASWPDSLRIVVGLCLTSHFPMMVAWGPDLIGIYNDGFRPILGRDKHPKALGSPTREVWAEIWDEIGPLFTSVFETREAIWSVDLPLTIERDGFPQTAFFTFSWSATASLPGSRGAADCHWRSATGPAPRRPPISNPATCSPSTPTDWSNDATKSSTAGCSASEIHSNGTAMPTFRRSPTS